MMHHHVIAFPMPIILILLVLAVLLAGEGNRRVVAVLLLFFLAAFGMCGCASLTPADNTEIAWQTLNVIDAGQTQTIARDPAQWQEVSPLARAIGGAHPSEGTALGISVGYGIAHYAVYRWLDYEDDLHPGHGWAQALGFWEAITIGDKGYAVFNNNRLGIKPWEGK